MNKKTESFLNGSTIVGYVLVAFVTFVSCVLLIMFAVGKFSPNYEKFNGLKFTAGDSVIINEENTINVRLVGKDAVQQLDENNNPILDEYGYPKYEDNTEPTKVKLTVRNAQNLIDNSIISVPSEITLGEYFEIQAKKADDGYNVGGICYLYAESLDEVYRVITPLEVKVDVPVESISIVASNPNASEGGQYDLDTQKFVYDDKVQFSVKILPERARYAYNTTEEKPIRFLSEATDNVSIDSNTGLAVVKYSAIASTAEELVEPSLKSKIIARVNKYNDITTATVSEECDLRLYPLQLSEIQINNPSYDRESLKVELYGEPLKISAEAISESAGIGDVTNLNVFLKPTIYNPNNNADPLTGLLLSNFNIGYSTDADSEIQKAFTIDTNLVNVGNKSIPYWIITPQRTQGQNEGLKLVFSVSDSGKSVEWDIDIEIKIPNTFTFVDENNEKISNANLQIVKYGSNVITPASMKINYAQTTEASTFNRYVFFVSGDNFNLTNSQIVQASASGGQIVLKDGDDDYRINALGAGTINIVAVLVKTDREGNPIDILGNVIQDGEATGYCYYENEAEALPGQYIAYAIFDDSSKLKVKVVELVKELNFYLDEDLTKKVDSQQAILMGTNIVNKASIYVTANSVLALPKDAEDYKDNWYATLKFTEKENGSTFSKPSDDSGATSLKFVSAEINGVYTRYFNFNVSTKQEVEDYINVEVWERQTQERVHSSMVNLKSVNVPVGAISADLDTHNEGGNLKELFVKAEIYENTVMYNEKTYARMRWTDETSGENIVLPNVTYSPVDFVYDEKGVSYDVSGFQPSAPNKQIMFYKIDTDTLYTIQGVGTMKMVDILNKAFDNSLSTTERDAIWVWLNNNVLVAQNSASDYVGTYTVKGVKSGNAYPNLYETLQFKKPLEQRYGLLMVYWALGGNGSVLESVNPDMVYINIQPKWANAEFGQATTEQTTQTIENEEYYEISSTEGVIFDLSQLPTASWAGKTFSVNTNIESSLTEVTLTNENNQLTVKLGSTLTAGTKFTITITKQFDYILDAEWNVKDDALWKKAVEVSSNYDNSEFRKLLSDYNIDDVGNLFKYTGVQQEVQVLNFVVV